MDSLLQVVSWVGFSVFCVYGRTYVRECPEKLVSNSSSEITRVHLKKAVNFFFGGMVFCFLIW